MVTPRKVDRKLGSPILIVAGAVSFAILLWMALASLRQPNLGAISESAVEAVLANDPDAYYDLLLDWEKKTLSREQFRKLWEISVEPRFKDFRAKGAVKTFADEFQAISRVRLSNDKGTVMTFAVLSDLDDRWAGVSTVAVLSSAWIAEALSRVPGTPEEEIDAIEAWAAGLTEDLPRLKEAGIQAIPAPDVQKAIPLDEVLESWQAVLAEQRRGDSSGS